MLRRRSFIVGVPAALVVAGSGAEVSLAQDGPRMRVFRDPGCECCRGWVHHVEKAGYVVRLEERPRTDPVRRTSGAPAELMGCHMALFDRFAFEGHVPVAAIQRFIADPGSWRGLAVPDMPVGSPGMEVEGVPPQTYDVYRYDTSGRYEAYARAKGPDLL